MLSVLRDETPEEDAAVGSRWKLRKEGVQQWIYEAGNLFCEKNAKQQGFGRERMLRELELVVESGWNDFRPLAIVGNRNFVDFNNCALAYHALSFSIDFLEWARDASNIPGNFGLLEQSVYSGCKSLKIKAEYNVPEPFSIMLWSARSKFCA